LAVAVASGWCSVLSLHSSAAIGGVIVEAPLRATVFGASNQPPVTLMLPNNRWGDIILLILRRYSIYDAVVAGHVNAA
jgi:hypothetical protein